MSLVFLLSGSQCAKKVLTQNDDYETPKQAECKHLGAKFIESLHIANQRSNGGEVDFEAVLFERHNPREIAELVKCNEVLAR